MCRADDIDRIYIESGCLKFDCTTCHMRGICNCWLDLFYDMLEVQFTGNYTPYYTCKANLISQMPVIYAEGENPLSNE